MQKPTTTEIVAKGGKSGMSLFLVTVSIATVAWFVWWGLGYTGFNHPFVFILACAFGLFMAFNIGGNDVANSFGTSVGAGTLSITQALIVAAVFEVSGAVIAGGDLAGIQALRPDAAGARLPRGAPEDRARRSGQRRPVRCRYDDNVVGIPYFKAGAHRFWGQDRLDAFLQHLGMADDGAPDGDDARTDTARGRR